MDKKLKKDLMGIFEKHGLKADDVESLESKEKVKKAKSSKGDAKVVADLTEKIAAKVAGMIADKKDLVKDDEKDLGDHIKAKVFTSWGGLREVEYPSDLTSLSKEEKIVTFFKALVYHRVDPASEQVLRALVEGTSAEGGYLVPEELRTEVFRLLPDLAVMRKIARTIPMSTDTLKLNSLAARPVAYWTAEYASKSTTSAEFGQVELSPNDLVCLLPISHQLLADANINLVSFITQLFAEAIAVAEDAAFFTGSGVGQPRGISIETISNFAAGTMDFDDLITLIDQVPQRVTQSPRAAFVGHRYVKRMLRQVKDTTNRYIWRDARAGTEKGETHKLPDTVYGYPFYEQNDLSQTELYFGDWSFYIIADRQTMAVTTTTEGGEAWRRNAMEVKAVERVDGRAVILTPFAKMTGIV
jgi:HK97 family phage major capsid protein